LVSGFFIEENAMKLLKDAIEGALRQAAQIEDEESKEMFERELWLHITSVLALRRRPDEDTTSEFKPDEMSLVLLNPACSYFTEFKEVFLSLYSPAENTPKEVEVY
jgi:hypothetical protein